MLNELKINAYKLGFQTNDVNELMLINEAYQEKMQDQAEMKAGFVASILSALTGKRVPARKLFNRPEREYSLNKRVERFKKQREEKCRN